MADTTNSSRQDRLLELTPAEKLVYYQLRKEGPLRRQELREQTLLSNQRVCQSILKLQQEHFIRAVSAGDDARDRMYDLTREAHAR